MTELWAKGRRMKSEDWIKDKEFAGQEGSRKVGGIGCEKILERKARTGKTKGEVKSTPKAYWRSGTYLTSYELCVDETVLLVNTLCKELYHNNHQKPRTSFHCILEIDYEYPHTSNSY